MTRARHVRAGAGWLAGWVALAAGAAGGCHRDATPEVVAVRDAGGMAPAGDRSPPSRRAELFEDPRARRALDRMARGADPTEPLEAIVADTGADPGDRCAASFLLGRVRLSADRFDAAAAAFERAARCGELAPIEDHVRLGWARARFGQGDLDGVLDVLGRGPLGPELAVQAELLAARTLLRRDEPDTAIARLSALLERDDLGRAAIEARVVLAEAYEVRGGDGDVRTAFDTWRAVLLATPESAYGRKAAERLADLDRLVRRKETKKAVRRFQRRLQLARAKDRLARRTYRAAVEAASGLVRDRRAEAALRCEAAYLAGTALFRARARVEAARWFRRATALCPDDPKSADLAVRSAYQAARGLYAAGRYDRAARAFERLARRHHDHRLADDAWLLAAESHLDAGDPAAAAAAWRKAAGAGGDMAFEGVRRLVVWALANGDLAQARAVLDGVGPDVARTPEQEACLAYLRARAIEASEGAAAARAAYERVFDRQRVGYYPMMAYGRLAALGAEEAARARLSAPAGEAPSPPGEGPVTARAFLLARLGLGAQARAALRAAGVRGWAAAFVLAKAGAHAQAQRVIAGLQGDLARAGPPGGPWGPALRVAYPRPFEAWVTGAARAASIPTALLFAFVQTESRFDPAAESPAGARGLVQLMPKTARSVAERAGLDPAALDLFDPVPNLRLGARYVGEMLTAFGGIERLPLAVAAYNAGPAAVRRWRRAAPDRPLDLFVEQIPYEETRKYTKHVLGRFFAYRFVYGGPLPAVAVEAEGRAPAP